MPRENSAVPEQQTFPNWLAPTGFFIGSAALGILLWVAVKYQSPSAFLFNVMRTLLALGGAAFSMSLSGLLVIRMNIPGKGYIVAGGTLAVFVVLYFFPPAGIQSTSSISPASITEKQKN